MKDKTEKVSVDIPCSRRIFLQYIGTAAGLALIGCGNDKSDRMSALPDPPADSAPSSAPADNRVVAVRDDKATTWDGQQSWYGSDSFVNQARVDRMITEGILTLTGKETETAAWQRILPEYSAGKKISIKINANNARSGGNVIDPLPQLLKALVQSLKAGGTDEQDIRFLEPSRTVADRIAKPVKNSYPGVVFYGASQTEYSSACTYDSSDTGLTIEHGNPDLGDSKLPDQLGSSTYLIHMPILKAHGMADITLTYKNLFGMFKESEIPKFHGTFFDTSGNPLVEIYANPNIADKTVLIMGDGIYGNWVNNHSAPTPWKNAFGSDLWPKTLFFSADPVAVDCVMYDYLKWQKQSLPERAETYLVQAAAAKQGARDHWSNPTDKKYSVIDFIQQDISTEA